MLSLGLAGNAHASSNGRDIVLSAGRRDALRYGGLAATDRRGRVLPSSMRIESGRIVIRVDDRAAEYPVRVDPFLQQAERTLADGAVGDLFAVVALSGDTLVVGAPGRTVGANQAQGTVYVFQRPASGWTNAVEVGRLTASDGAPSDRLGGSLALNGDTIVPGATGHKVGPNDGQGAAYVFLKPASGWSNAHQSTVLRASAGASEDNLGRAVAVSGDQIVLGAPDHSAFVAGAPGHQVGLARQGAAYVFARGLGNLVGNMTHTAELTAPDGCSTDLFGLTLASTGNVVAIGGGLHLVGGMLGSGAAYVFGAIPQIVIQSPGAGSTPIQGTSTAASFDCVPAGSATIASCGGPVASGAPIDTGSAGPHTFTVTALDSDGVSASRSVTYSVMPAPKPRDATLDNRDPSDGGSVAPGPPSRANRESTPISRRTTFSFTLDQPAAVSLGFALQLPGRRVRGHCVSPSRANKRSSPCTRVVAGGELRFSGHADATASHSRAGSRPRARSNRATTRWRSQRRTAPAS